MIRPVFRTSAFHVFPARLAHDGVPRQRPVRLFAPDPTPAASNPMAAVRLVLAFDSEHANILENAFAAKVASAHLASSMQQVFAALRLETPPTHLFLDHAWLRSEATRSKFEHEILPVCARRGVKVLLFDLGKSAVEKITISTQTLSILPGTTGVPGLIAGFTQHVVEAQKPQT